MEIMHALAAVHSLGAITLILIGVVCIRHSLRRMILHTGVRHV